MWDPQRGHDGGLGFRRLRLMPQFSMKGAAIRIAEVSLEGTSLEGVLV